MKPTVTKLLLLYFPSKSNKHLPVSHMSQKPPGNQHWCVYSTAADCAGNLQLKHLMHQRTTRYLRDKVSFKSVKYTSDSHMFCSEAVNMAAVQHIGADTGSEETITVPCRGELSHHLTKNV